MPNEWEHAETPPTPETSSRRPDFLGGPTIWLADGRAWAFAGPDELATADPPLRSEVRAIVGAIAEANDEPERLRGELALAIRLLAANYELAPADYARLLDLSPGDPRMAGMQAGFRDLARRHVATFWPREEKTPVVTESRRSRFSIFRPHRPAVASVLRSKRAF